MTNSGCASGASGGGNNLKTDYYDDFADYLSEVVLHFRDSFGVTFRTLEPLNEPNGDWWNSMGAQEGCHFDRSLQAQLLRGVRSRLDAKGLQAVQLSAPDESSIDDSVDSYASYDTPTKAVLYQINTHIYAGSRRADLRTAATRDSKKLWSSEVDGSGAPAPFDVYAHNHDDIVPGLDIANRITRDLKDMQVDAWVFWQAVENEQAQVSLNKNWGLLHGDFVNATETWTVTKKYYSLMQYTRSIRPGATMLDANQTDAVVFLNRADSTLTIVQRNAGTSSSVFGYDLTAFTAVGAVATAYRTSATENYARLPDIAVANKRLISQIAARSITTFVVSGVTAP
jgi:O-glycosyl hydrolase